MLQKSSATANPPQFVAANSVSRWAKLEKATSIIRADVSPVRAETDLPLHLEHLKAENDVIGVIVLYEAMIAMSDAALLFLNQPRCEESDKTHAYLESEWDRLVSKSYLIADTLRQMKPAANEVERWAGRLIDSGFRMGEYLSEIAEIAVQASLFLNEEREIEELPQRGEDVASLQCFEAADDPVIALVEDRNAKEDAFHAAYDKFSDAFEAARDDLAEGKKPRFSKKQIAALESASDAAHELRMQANKALSTAQPTTPAGAAAVLRVILGDEPDFCTPWHAEAAKSLASSLEHMRQR
jgi:hypothetical protein